MGFTLHYRKSLALGLLMSSASAFSQVPKRPVIPLGPIESSALDRLAARMGYPVAGRNEEGICLGCHADFNNPEQLYNLQPKTNAAYACIADGVESKADAVRAVECLNGRFGTQRPRPRHFAFMSAAFAHSGMKRIYDLAERSAEYEKILQAISMPPGGDGLSDQEAETLMSWVTQGFPDIYRYIRYDGPETCSSSKDTVIGSDFRKYIEDSRDLNRNWRDTNLARGMRNFACQDHDPSQCFSQKIAEKEIFPTRNEWLAKGTQSQIRLLYNYPEATAYWIRSSADGRYVAGGGTPSTIVDLLPKLKNEPARNISVDADYDPAFMPDNRAFMFQSFRSGAQLCDQDMLSDPALSSIDFSEANCVSGGLDIGLYQSVASSLGDGDMFTIEGMFKEDEGYFTAVNVAPYFHSEASLNYSSFRKINSRRYQELFRRKVASPYHGNWILSPANRIALATVSSSNGKEPIHGGYRLFLIDEKFGENERLPPLNSPSSALICTGGGEKPQVSYDERFLSYYRYLDGPRNTAMTASKSDIFVVDLLGNGQSIALTDMPLGYYAQFPHFRSDGWLYFSVYDAWTGRRQVLASDFVIKSLASAPGMMGKNR